MSHLTTSLMMHANYQMKSMEHALHAAACNGHAELVKLLLDRDASVTSKVSEKMYISMLGPIY